MFFCGGKFNKQMSHTCRSLTRIPYMLLHVAAFCQTAMEVDRGKLRHFCDDPVCPDPVWKLLVGKGQMGSALIGSLQFSCVLTEKLFVYPRPPTFVFQKVLVYTFFPNLSKSITFAAAPLVLTPFVRNQMIFTLVALDCPNVNNI